MAVLDHINLDGTNYEIQDAGAYRKPNGGIPKSDMSDGVKESLTRADNAAPQSSTYTKSETDTKLSEKANANNVYTKSETDERLSTKANTSDVNAAIGSINGKIPSEASSVNQLADKQFVNSSIATATATFRGTYNLVSDLAQQADASHAQIEAALGRTISGADNNDYAFVQVPTSTSTPTQIAKVERYKYNGTAWRFEYELNSSGFTASQWAAINSGITSSLVTKLSQLPTNAQLTTLLLGKQDVIQDLETIRSGAQKGATSVQPADIADTPDFVEEGLSEELEDEYERILQALYQALTDAGVEITAAQEAAALAQAKAILANDAATLANDKATYAQQKGDYAKQQGDYAKAKGDEVEQAHGTYQTLDARLNADEQAISNVGNEVTQVGNAVESVGNEVSGARGDYQNLDERLDAMETNVEFVEDNTDGFDF